MRIFKRSVSIACSTCGGDGRIEASTAKVGKGWTRISRKCHRCNGKGTLPRR